MNLKVKKMTWNQPKKKYLRCDKCGANSETEGAINLHNDDNYNNDYNNNNDQNQLTNLQLDHSDQQEIKLDCGKNCGHLNAATVRNGLKSQNIMKDHMEEDQIQTVHMTKMDENDRESGL